MPRSAKGVLVQRALGRSGTLALLLFVASTGWAHAPDAVGIAQHSARLREHPDDVQSLVARGELLLYADRVEEAERDFRRARSMEPGNVAAALGLADARRRAGDLAEAEGVLGELLRRIPQTTAAWRLVARVELDGGDAHGAAEAQDRVLASDPVPADFAFRAEIAALEGHAAEALSILDQGAVRLNSAALRWRAVDAAAGLADFDAALRHLAVLERQMERPAVVVARRGDILNDAGRTAEAWAEWTRALELLETAPAEAGTTSSEALRVRLGTLLAGEGQP